VFLGMALSDQERYEEAAVAFQHAAELSDSVNVPGHPDTADAWRRYGQMRYQQGDRAEAERALRDARRLYLLGLRTAADSVSIGDDLAVVDTLLARTVGDDGRADEAVSLLREALEMAVEPELVAAIVARIATYRAEPVAPDTTADNLDQLPSWTVKPKNQFDAFSASPSTVSTAPAGVSSSKSPARSLVYR
jgi:tetratricopeptide (TPR) repeat protein